MGICPQALEFWSGLRVQRGQPGLPGTEKHQMSVRERPEGGLRGDIGAPKSDLGSRGQLGSFIGAWGSLSNEELGVRPQCLRTEGTGRNINLGGNILSRCPSRLAMALCFSGRTWETPGPGRWLCPRVHALLRRLPRPVFARGILGTRALSLYFCYITASLPSMSSALQRAGAEAGAWRKASSPDRRLPESPGCQSLPPQHAQRGSLISVSVQCIFSAEPSGPILVPHEHSTCQWPHTGHGFPELAGLGGSS